ncbi:kinase-like domain-containing protein [Rhizophagus clarus]|uniref:Kinase-like domain-containing protein n=1 Tax=Rhizophagus clarus TaxID=94130 RepID=A0A8H3R6U8_9GLOM|nr:kinase-like domain-containing protein [Rhizophagus clarus]
MLSIFGISKNKCTICYETGNEKIDKLIQKAQSNIDDPNKPIFEWISYHQFNIKDMGKDGLSTVYLAIWKDGPLYWGNKKYARDSGKTVVLKSIGNFGNSQNMNLNEKNHSMKWYIDLKIYGMTQNPDSKDYMMVLNNKYFDDYFKGYCVKCDKMFENIQYKWCKPCQIDYFKKNFISSRNDEIDDLIQEMHSKINDYKDIVFEWIPYNQFDQFDIIKDVGMGLVNLYSAVWKDGPLEYDTDAKKYERRSNKLFTLKFFNTTHNVINDLSNEIREYSINADNNVLNIYGISQNPNTKEFIMIFESNYYEKYCEKCGKVYTNMYKWCKSCQLMYLKENLICESEQISDLIREMQLKINNPKDMVFEWIPFNQFYNINKEIDNGFSTVYSAKWKDGPLYWNNKKWTRGLDKLSDIQISSKSNKSKQVSLKCLGNSQNINDELNKVKLYSINYLDSNIKLYGMSQMSDTKDYVLVFESKHYEKYCANCDKFYIDNYKWCKACQVDYLTKNFTNLNIGNEKLVDFIKEMQLKINYPTDIVFEWISFNQFSNIRKVGKDQYVTVYSATWKEGPLKYNTDKRKYERHSNQVFALICLSASQNIMNKVREYSINFSATAFKIYGISQNLDTKNYVMVLEDRYCEKYCKRCCKEYTDINYKWCKQCQIISFTNWSGNEKIDKLIKEIQQYNHYLAFEWIPYDQFAGVQEISKGGFSTIYSAIWKNGPLNYNENIGKWAREPDKLVALKCLFNSQSLNDKFLSKIKSYLVNDFEKSGRILKMYGLTQNPITKDYVFVLQFTEGGNFNYWINTNNNSKYFNWLIKLKVLDNTIKGLDEIHQKKMVHSDLHTGNILFKEIYWVSSSASTYISDVGFCGNIGNEDESKIYGVMPYLAPEVLRGNPYTQAADIYSFGMIMYFVATGRLPFANREHDQNLALDICKGIRPEISESEAPKCYIDLMKRCWDSDPANRLDASEIARLIRLFHDSYNPIETIQDDEEIEEQFKEAEKYRRANNDNQSPIFQDILTIMLNLKAFNGFEKYYVL